MELYSRGDMKALMPKGNHNSNMGNQTCWKIDSVLYKSENKSKMYIYSFNLNYQVAVLQLKKKKIKKKEQINFVSITSAGFYISYARFYVTEICFCLTFQTYFLTMILAFETNLQ